VNTPSVLFDGAVSLRDLCYNGKVVGLANEINRFFSARSAAGVCSNDPAFNVSWPAVPAAHPDSSHEPNGSFMLAIEDVRTMFGP
jgi:hypothetical protein